MAVSDLAITDLTVADIEAGLKLSDEAGWNQTGDDWRLFLSRGRTIGVRDQRGALVASAAALPYAKDFGFVAMVLVTAAWRRRGLATKLVDLCIERIRGWGLTPMLDATPAGALVYRQQGFFPLFDLDRWQANAGGGDGKPDANTGAPDLDDLIALDAPAIGAERGFLIQDFMARPETRAFMSEGGEGFALIRRGRRAWQIGPLVANSSRDAIRLFEQVLRAAGSHQVAAAPHPLADILPVKNGENEAGRNADAPLFPSLWGEGKGEGQHKLTKGFSHTVFIDVPTVWTEVGDWLAARGFTKQRGFTRMAHGRTVPFGAPDLLFATAGPEFG